MAVRVFSNEEMLLGSALFARGTCRSRFPHGNRCGVREVLLFCTTAHIGFLRKPTAVSAVAGNHTAFKESRRQVSRTQNRLRKGAGPRQKASGKKGIHAPLFFVNKDLPPAPATKRNSLRRPETIPEWMNSPISFSCLKIGASPVW